jgi:hypothetical protein
VRDETFGRQLVAALARSTPPFVAETSPTEVTTGFWASVVQALRRNGEPFAPPRPTSRDAIRVIPDARERPSPKAVSRTKRPLVFRLRRTYLTGADLTDRDLTDTDLAEANLVLADLILADLAGADLTGANLIRADLTGADLLGADLAGADLTGANLIRANLTGADLTGANLTDVKLRGANLIRADLTGADLTGANLTGANLTGADLTGADLHEAQLGFIPQRAGDLASRLGSVRWSVSTKWPSRVRPLVLGASREVHIGLWQVRRPSKRHSGTEAQAC